MSTINKLNIFSENDINVGAECPECNRVLKIAKKNLHRVNDGFHLEGSITCICGSVYFDIFLSRKPIKPATKIRTLSAEEFQRRANEESQRINKSLYIIIGLCLIGLMWMLNRHDSPEEIAHKIEVAEKEKADEKVRDEWHKERAAASLEGYNALVEFDDVIRDGNARRRKALEKAAIKHEHNNGYGLPATVDLYTMKDGRLVLCTTSISSTGAIMNCDGEP